MFDIIGRLGPAHEINEGRAEEDQVMIPAGVPAGAVAEVPADPLAEVPAQAPEEIIEDELVLIHAGVRLDRNSSVRLTCGRLLSYPAPIWGTRAVTWARVVQREKVWRDTGGPNCSSSKRSSRTRTSADEAAGHRARDAVSDGRGTRLG
jgi:hypothetical protein